MHLTKEEERIYDGEQGWANQVCIKILAKLGDLFGADKLIPINSAHVSGVSYKTLGDPPIEFLKALAEAGTKARVKTTLNPQSIDPTYLKERLKRRLVERQLNILEQFEKMGITQSLTCTPHYAEKPAADTHLAWAESSAVVYANSVLHAWTNREGGPSALAAAVIGRTPDYGIHRAENREPKIAINLDMPLKNETEFGALGIYLGRTLKDDIPLIKGIESAEADDLKQLGASLASTGMLNMFDYPRRKQPNAGEGLEKIRVDSKAIQRETEELTTTADAKPDLVFLGCPHCSKVEIEKIAFLLKNRKVKKGLECWVCTSPYVRESMTAQIDTIEMSGAHVLAGVCTIVSWTEELGIKTILTNSAKTAHYAPTLNKAEMIFRPIGECLKAAVQG